MEDLHASDPRIFGPYRLLSRIGSGGMGVVFLVENGSGSRVALKLLRPELADDLVFRARFRREVEAGRRVGGVCTARYRGCRPGFGASLSGHRVRRRRQPLRLRDGSTGRRPGTELIGLAVGLAEALAVTMNSVGVIHRDLKPSNVLMAPTGPKVVDFGISHAADGTALPKPGGIIGSPGWMAPEQALGYAAASPAIDVFSWGATVAYAATGRSPFGEGRPGCNPL